MNLNEAQSPFSSHLINIQTKPVASDSSRAEEGLILPQAFEIYHHAYFTRLTSSLNATFNSVQRLMGAEAFRELCHEYIASRPSTDYMLTDYGQNFPDFLSHSPLNLERPLLAELARFEWQVQRLAHAPAQEPIAANDALKALQTEDCQVRFIEAMVVFHSNHGVYDVWRDTLDPQIKPENLLIFRRRGRVQVERLTPAEGHLLKGLQEGKPLSHALNATSDWSRPGEIQSVLSRLADREIIEDLLILET
ncbi:MAG: putative DNA-binding domain-containing protein [Bdellovibrio sp.]|nr:putative DNA-binding domain-containing protein [Bdellovibrio sp.]